jgi:predicted Ser/Thr protein kinase
MASWEQALIAAVTQVAGGENPIQNIDHEAKVIEIKRDARVDPAVLRGTEQVVEELGIGYRVEQLT